MTDAPIANLNRLDIPLRSVVRRRISSSRQFTPRVQTTTTTTTTGRCDDSLCRQFDRFSVSPLRPGGRSQRHWRVSSSTRCARPLGRPRITDGVILHAEVADLVSETRRMLRALRERETQKETCSTTSGSKHTRRRDNTTGNGVERETRTRSARAINEEDIFTKGNRRISPKVSFAEKVIINVYIN